MPARLAATDAFKSLSEVVGSGPFRFLPDQYVSGGRAVFARFNGYVPRDEAPSATAGGKRALLDRVEWRVMPEAATAAAALRTGEVDWVEQPLIDLLPQLRADRALQVDRLDPFGLYPVLRMNCLQGPTANQGVRQAILAAINPVEVMQAVMGDDSTAYHAPIGCFLPGTESANDAGMDRLGGQRPVADIKRMLDAAKYDGSAVVLLHPTDQPFYDAMAQVTLATLTRIGVAVDDSAMDFGTVVQRRASKEPLGHGGWSMFSSSFPALDYVDPLGATRPAWQRRRRVVWLADHPGGRSSPRYLAGQHGPGAAQTRRHRHAGRRVRSRAVRAARPILPEHRLEPPHHRPAPGAGADLLEPAEGVRRALVPTDLRQRAAPR